MKAIILTPTFFPQLTGNAVTAGRIAQELTEGGIECRVINLSAVGEAEVEKATRKFGPDLVHGFHAYKSGRIGLSKSEANAVVEALTFGKVVVGRHISGNTSLLAEKTGFLFRNRKELYEQILRILRNKKEATETGRRAKRFIAARFQRNREQVDYLRLYRETANQRFGCSSRSMNHPDIA